MSVSSFYPSLTDRAPTLRPQAMSGCYRVLSIGLLLGALVAPVAAQTAISLNTLIGAPGTNAATVAGAGNVVNNTGVALSGSTTTLTAAGSPIVATFNFTTGFSDSLGRTTGSTAGAPNVWADR